MNNEQQLRINFLDEAEDCFHTIESVLIGLSSTIAQPQQLDAALRGAHSVKGGAAMMGFLPLSRIAHRMEDCFKILRVRYHSTKISTEIETLLLLALDGLRQISDLHRQGVEIEESWLQDNINPIFDNLGQYLGELQDEDENALLAQNEDTDPALLIFEEEVETVLDQFEEHLATISPLELPDTLMITAEKLSAFGQLANLEPFIQLCESVQQEVISSTKEPKSLAQQALTVWRRSLALVVRRSLDKLPCQLEGGTQEEEVSLLDNQMALELLQDQDFVDFAANVEEISAANFEGLETVLESEELAQLQSALALESLTQSPETLITPVETFQKTTAKPTVTKTVQQSGKMVRVPVEQFYQLNTLLGKLILERNKVNLRLELLNSFAALMRQRMNQLEDSNNQLRKWYDRASLEGIVPITEQPLSALSQLSSRVGQNFLRPKLEEFDALEMDRYSDLHLISQEQIETIVQLQEVSADIELGIQEVSQAVQELNQTTRSLQGNVTRTQMLPFAEVVKPFPRLVRDLSHQFGKQVNLKIKGETTLLDRTIAETLNAPLMHLIRNAFDHGIEDTATRTAIGKPPSGTITIEAFNRGTQTIITVQDDGGGIRLDKIRHRLREMGVALEESEQMSPSEILDYIFHPGFSTTAQVTELSGRGVGMDVVRTNLHAIRGDIHVQTQTGEGTTFTLTVPFTLSILRIMLVERAGIVFAVPVNSIREVLRLQAVEATSFADLEQITWRNQIIPLVRLEEKLIFNRPSKPFEMQGNPVIDKPTALIVGDGTSLGGFHIDRFWGEQEVTIRPIDSPLPLPRGFISSMVLGYGRVLPLVEPVELLQGCLEDKTTKKTTEITPTDKVFPDKVNTILVVDDSINVRRYLTLTLEKAGYQVEQAKDGREAVDKLFGGLSVQAVICDIEMPRLDGYGVLEEVKGKSEFQSLPIAMLTSRSNEKHRKLALNLGASAYFSKPYNEQELLQKIADLIRV